jgi:hypothetical protein
MTGLTPEQMTTLDELAPQEPQDAPQEVQTAFLVVQHLNGQWSAHSDYEEISIAPQRKAHTDDFVSGAANITVSVSVQQAAMHTIIAMNQQAQAMQQQMEAQKIANGLDLSHLRK